MVLTFGRVIVVNVFRLSYMLPHNKQLVNNFSRKFEGMWLHSHIFVEISNRPNKMNYENPIRKGKLYFRYGTMGSAKTAMLLTTAYNFEERGMDYLHEADCRQPRERLRDTLAHRHRAPLQLDLSGERHV